MSNAATDDRSDAEPSRAGHGGRDYVVVARRYRPQTFGELIGQQMVARALRNAIESDRVGHAYLFTGARGVGKTSAARILAKSLNCVQGPTVEPCGRCDVCVSVSRGEDMDVLEIDGASNRGIDEIRQLRSNVNVRPSRARFKIYIIDEVHMLTREAFNALLKTLEEPPAHVKFVFCTTDPDKIPVTVVSRCQRYDFAPVETSAIVQRLAQIVQAEGAEADEDALELLARRAAGSLRDSQSLLEQLLAFAEHRITVDDVHRMLGTARTIRLRTMVEHLVDRNAAAALAELDVAVGEGVDVGQLAEQLLGYLRDIMAVSVGCGPDLLLHVGASDHPALAEAATRWGMETILAAVQILDQTLARVRQSVHVRTLVEMALVRMAQLEDLQALPELISQLKGGEQGFQAGQTGAAGPRAAAATARPEQSLRPEPSSARAPSPERPDVSGGVPQKASPEPVPPAKKKSESASGDAAADQTPQVTANSQAPDAVSAQWASADDTWQAMTPESAVRLWQQALEHLNDMTADCGRRFDSLATFAPNRLVVTFRQKYNSSKLYCERPEGRSRLERALAETSGKTIRLEFRLVQDEAEAKPANPVASVRQRLREAHSHPLVQQAVKLFGAEVSHVDLPPSGQ